MGIEASVAYVEKLAEHLRGELAAAKELPLKEASAEWHHIEELQRKIAVLEGAMILIEADKDNPLVDISEAVATICASIDFPGNMEGKTKQ